ncbi:MAG: XTP/dITP diphosphatase [Nitrospirales bacterium]|nr:XTP/dITP diphosphatase [Nitrospirales bacterium]
MGIDVVLATGNPHKRQELLALLGDVGYRIRTMDEFSSLPEIIEDGETCEANAIKKATILARHTGLLALADDTGLEVDALNGRPGVYAARYAGEQATYEDNCQKLLQELDGIPREKRTARFRTVMALVEPSLQIEVVEGILEGLIVETSRGTQGFGYDPVFWVPNLDCTLAELTVEQKNRISHRAQALEKAKTILNKKRETHHIVTGRSAAR